MAVEDSTIGTAVSRIYEFNLTTLGILSHGEWPINVPSSLGSVWLNGNENSGSKAAHS
jgi:hypothetical protein